MRIYKMDLKENINLEKLPQHIAIIMDGNGRWAKQQGELRTFGHINGVTAVRETSEAAAEIGLKYLTLYAFSTENWNRPEEEINALMDLLVSTIEKETPTLNKNNIRLQAIGDLKSLPESSYHSLMKAINNTKDNTGLTMVLALSYSARWEIVEAVKKIAGQVKNEELDIKDIDAKVFESNLCTNNIPDPELLIRTSGEQRISNFLLWQIGYSELYFTSKLWPDFKKQDLYQAILDYQNRERRFGKTSEQLNK
ncbi:MAG: isoprenyl transferase [Hyphomicrobiales bacterium]